MTKALLLALTLGVAANAAPITFQDIVDPADMLLSAQGQKSYTYTHNILDNGFVPSVYSLTNVRLNLYLSDDGDKDFLLILPLAPEVVSVEADNTLVGLFEVDNGNYHLNVDPTTVQQDGKLTVTVTALLGDFYFEKSELTAEAPAPAPVPEPGSLALTGLGLLGLGFAAKRRKSKTA